MKRTIKYISVLFLFLLFFNSCCLATDINMNLQSNVETNQVDDTISQNEITQNTPNYTNISSSTSTSNDDTFSIGNIINIFLVVVGIVLILLGLAILIRLKY